MDMKEFLKVAEDFNEEIKWRADLLRSVKYPKEKGYYPHVVSSTSYFGATVTFESTDSYNPTEYFDVDLTLKQLTCDKEVISRLFNISNIRQKRLDSEAEKKKKIADKKAMKDHISYLTKQLEKLDEK